MEIEILKGIEIGQGIYRKKETEALLEKYDYDFVLGSLHNLENMEDFFFLDYKNYDIDYTFNVVNKYALAFFNELGADNITLSCELTLKQIKDLIDEYHETFKKHPNTSVIINSYVEAMISKYSLNITPTNFRI